MIVSQISNSLDKDCNAYKYFGVQRKSLATLSFLLSVLKVTEKKVVFERYLYEKENGRNSFRQTQMQDKNG